MEKTKLCKACGIEKPIDLFYSRPDTKDKLFSRCKKCINDNVFIEGFDKNYTEYKNRLGEIAVNNEGYEMQIIEYNDANNIVVQFLDDNKGKVKTAYREFKKGNVRNYFHKSYLGVGFLGYGDFKVKENNTKTKAYVVWGSMLTRCYKEDRNLTYNNVTVCEEWHNFQNFAKWFYENWKPYMEDWHLDKDIICPKNRIYSPETCCFIPKEINSMFTSSEVRELPKGVYKTKYGYKAINFQSSTKGNASKTFKTIKEAEDFYKKSKTLKLQTILLRYSNLDDKVYKILKEYKF